MILRIDKLAIELPMPAHPSPNSASAVQELLGGKFGEMSTLMNYTFQSFNFRGRDKMKPSTTSSQTSRRKCQQDSRLRNQWKKDDPADVARVGFDAMMRGDGDVVSGWKNKLQSAIANVTPAGVLAEQHRRMAEPGFAEKANE